MTSRTVIPMQAYADMRNSPQEVGQDKSADAGCEVHEAIDCNGQ